MKPHRNKERVNGLEHLCVKRMEDSRIEASRMEALREKMIVSCNSRIGRESKLPALAFFHSTYILDFVVG